MGALDVYAEPKWSVLTYLAKGAKSPTEIAKHLKTSLSNTSQQLKLLEAMGFVKASYERNNKPGKPHKKYALCKTENFLGIISPQTVNKQVLSLTNAEQAIFNLYLLNDSKITTLLQKFFLTKEYFLKHAKSIVVLHRKTPEIQLLVIADDVDHIRKHYSHEQIKVGDVEKKIAIWSHTPQEFKEGLGRKEAYFQDLTKNNTVIFDPQDTARILMEGLL